MPAPTADQLVNPYTAAGEIQPADAMEVSRTVSTPPFDERYQQRVEDNQDLVTVISDYHNRRGTGKSTLSLLMGEYTDRTDEGLTIEKCTLSAGELIDKYTSHPEGSALVLDEAEAQVSKYSASSHVNRALRELVSMGRVEEKYLFMNMPASDQLDQDLLGLADVWVLITRKGQAIIHLLKGEPYNAKILTPKSEVIDWSDMPVSGKLRQIHNQLTKQKRARLRNEEGDENLIKESEVRERIERAEKQAEKDKRDEIIRGLVNKVGLGPSDIAGAFEVKRARISQIANEAGD